MLGFNRLSNMRQAIQVFLSLFIVYALVANKVDLLHSQQFSGEESDIVGKEQGEAFAKTINASFHEVSAKTMQGIRELFS